MAPRAHLFALVALVALAGPVSAHADLLSAVPRPNSQLASAPDQLVLSFSEPLEDRYTRVELVDADGADHVTSFDIDSRTRTKVTAEVGDAPDGLYTVRWRTLSVDTHTKSGQYLLAINVPLIPGTEPPEDPHAGHAAPSSYGGSLEAAARALLFMGAILAAGIPFFLLAIHREPLAPEVRRLLALACLGALLAAVAGLAVAQFLAQRIDGTLADALATRTGQLLGVRSAVLGVAALALAGAGLARSTRPRHALIGTALGLGLLALLLTSLTGHSAAHSELRTAIVGNDLLHLTAAAFWLGGVVSLLALAFGPPPDERMVQLVNRFTPFAIPAVAVIVITGTIASVQRLSAVGDLVAGLYGRALLWKMVVVLPLIGLGWYNGLRLPKLLARPGAGARRRLRATLLAEVLLMTTVVGAAGILANTAPPSSTVVPDIEPAPEPVVRRFEGDGLNVTVLLAPLPVQVGLQNLTVRVTPIDREMPDNAAVGVRLSAPSASGETSSRQLTRLNETAWRVQDALFTEAGPWTVLVFVQGRATFLSDEFEIEVAPAGSTPEPNVSHSHDAAPGSPLLQPGDVFQWTPPAAGTFTYHCHPHPWMTATVIVEDPGDRPPRRAQAEIVDGSSVQDYEFHPRTITIGADDTIVWTNNGTVAHTVTADEAGGEDHRHADDALPEEPDGAPGIGVALMAVAIAVAAVARRRR